MVLNPTELFWKMREETLKHISFMIQKEIFLWAAQIFDLARSSNARIAQSGGLKGARLQCNFTAKWAACILKPYPEIFDFAEGLMQSFPKSLIWQKATAGSGAQHGKAIPTATPARYRQLDREINSKVLRIS